MGEIRANVKLENSMDRALAMNGKLSEDKVRSLEISALVDTGAVMTLLPQEVAEQLGLVLDEKVIVTLADDSKAELHQAGYLTLKACGRTMHTDCLVGPPQCEPLIGQLVLERLDLILDPLKRTVTVRPESPFLPSLKLK